MQPKHRVRFFSSFSTLCYRVIPLTLFSPMTTTPTGINSIPMMLFHRIWKEDDWKSPPLFPSWRKKTKYNTNTHTQPVSNYVITELKTLKTLTPSLSLTVTNWIEEFEEREEGAYGCAWLFADRHSWSTWFQAFNFCSFISTELFIILTYFICLFQCLHLLLPSKFSVH